MSPEFTAALAAYEACHRALVEYLVEGDGVRRAELHAAYCAALRASVNARCKVSTEEAEALAAARDAVRQRIDATAPAPHPNAVAEIDADREAQIADDARRAEKAVAATAAVIAANVRKSLYTAVEHVLTTAQRDPDFGYVIGPGTESYELLCRAEALHLGEPLDVVYARRGEDLQPEHRKREPEVCVLRDRVQKLGRELADAREALARTGVRS